MRQGTSGFYCVPNFTPTCFGKWLPPSGDRRCLISYSSNFCVVGVHRLWSIYAHNTDVTWVAYKAPMTPWRWHPLAETCRGKIWNTLIKSTSFLMHLLVILLWCYKMLGPAIKIMQNLFWRSNWFSKNVNVFVHKNSSCKTWLDSKGSDIPLKWSCCTQNESVL
jgi:hypothetical protein